MESSHFLPFPIISHELEKITIRAILHSYIVTDLYLSVDGDWLLLLEAANRYDVWMPTKLLCNLIFLLGVTIA